MGSHFWLKLTIAAAVIGVLAWQAPILAVVAVIAGTVLALAQNAARLRAAQAADPTIGLSLDSQARIRPLLQARRDIAEIAERNQKDPAIKVIGTEAVQEAEELIARAAALLRSRTELQRAGKTDDTGRIDRLRAQIEVSSDLQEKDQLEAALAVAENTVEHDERRATALGQIDAQLEASRAALEELKSRLAASLTEGIPAQDDLREALGRLKSLGTSLDEAQALLRETP